MAKRSKKLTWLIFLILAAVLAVGIYYYYYYTETTKPKDYVRVYFTRDDSLVPVERGLSKEADPAYVALTELLKGPTEEEIKNGLFTQIPLGVTAKIIGISGKIITVDFSKKLSEYGGGTTRVQGLVAQIVYTLTDIRGIDRVSILLAGQSNIVLGGEGYVIDRPLSREDVTL